MAKTRKSSPLPPYVPKAGVKHGTKYGKGGKKKKITL